LGEIEGVVGPISGLMASRPANIQQPAADEIFELVPEPAPEPAATLAASRLGADTIRLLRELGDPLDDAYGCPDWARGGGGGESGTGTGAAGKADPYSALDAMYGDDPYYDDPDDPVYAPEPPYYGPRDPYYDDLSDPYYGGDPYAKGDYGGDPYAKGGTAPGLQDLDRLAALVATVDDTTVATANRLRLVEGDVRAVGTRLAGAAADLGGMKADLAAAKASLADLPGIRRDLATVSESLAAIRALLANITPVVETLTPVAEACWRAERS
jgi:hypothetical protein